MSTQEMAINILKQFSEKELERFIAYFGIIYPVKTDEETLTEKQRALKELGGMIHHIPNLDDEKELAEYREEKYGQ